MDSVGFSEETLKDTKEMRWLMRVPETLVQAKKLVKETQVEAMDYCTRSAGPKMLPFQVVRCCMQG
jgi:hypothetical protein